LQDLDFYAALMDFIDLIDVMDKDDNRRNQMEHGRITTSLAHFCKDTCPVCTRAREKGKGVLYQVVKIERHVCPMCRSYQKVYGVPAHEKSR
jgi:hypothetical protein